MKKVKLYVQSVSVGGAGRCSLWLMEHGGNRCFAVGVSVAEAQFISEMLDPDPPSRPLTHDLFATVFEVLGVKMVNATIHKVEEDMFYTHIYMRCGNTMLRIDSRPSDAVALALRMKAPIYIHEDLLNTLDEGMYMANACQPSHEETIKMLNTALQEAIDREEYENAAALRDKIKRMKEQQ